MKDFLYLVSLEIIVTLVITLLTFKVGDNHGNNKDMPENKEQDNN